MESTGKLLEYISSTNVASLIFIIPLESNQNPIQMNRRTNDHGDVEYLVRRSPNVKASGFPRLREMCLPPIRSILHQFGKLTHRIKQDPDHDG